jgi:proliferating cell nuclear antigen PCNA
MTIIFNAKTTDAYHIKILVELLTNNLKVAHFEIDEVGIRLCMMDSNRKILIDLFMLAENFSSYKYKGKKMYLGINLNHFHRMLKSIKKKDSLQLYIDDDTPNRLNIKVIPKENNRLTTSSLTIQAVQELAIEIPQGYGKPVIVSSSEFSKALKDICSIGVNTTVISKNFHITFKCESGGILERIVEFGENESVDDSTDKEYKQDFITEQLLRITKIAGLSTQIKIFPGKPLLFRSNIGNLGEISLYIKSKEQIEDESHIMPDEYDSD